MNSPAAGSPNGDNRSASVINSRIEAQRGRMRPLEEVQAAFVRGRIAHNKPLTKKKDLLQLAENLNRIVEQACTVVGKDGRCVTKSAIAEEASMLDSNGKSGRFYDYMVDPSLPEEEKRKRVETRLVKKPANYLKIAEVAARLAGQSTDWAAITLVDRTGFAEGMDALSEDSEAEHLHMLADALKGEARRIADATGLNWYFRTIDEQGLSPNGSNWEPDAQAFLWTWMATPWIDLFTEEVAAFPALWWTKERNSKPQEKIARVCRRVSLALAPFGPNQEVRAYLVRRPVLAVTDKPKIRREGERPDFFDFDASLPVITWMPDERGNVSRADGSALAVDPSARMVEGCYACDIPGDDHEFLEITGGTLASVLESGFPLVNTILQDAFHLPAVAYTKSPPDSRAARLERLIRKGEYGGDEKSRLTVRLEAKAREYVDGLRGWVDAERARIEEEMFHMAGGGQ
ncbi:hypothetical protein ABMY26_27620 [Azospirillum sp. HJ39]|uniref:hypothetical protein n=1 Tax=Azospirillum sp. HJ39 TaxID=3159496 RepID=UPI0035580D76